MKKRKIITLILIVVLVLGTVMSGDAATRIKTNDVRLGGRNRFATAEKGADYLYNKQGKFGSIVLASGLNFPDALSGGYLAYVKDAPIILTSPGNESETAAYIRARAKSNATIYILGGTGAVSKKMSDTLTGFKVVRLGGANRFSTNLKILNEVGSVTELLIASGTNFADSLSASSAKRPIMIVGSSITNEQRNWIKSAGIKKIYILGGKGAVNGTVESTLKTLATVKRLGGKNRYATSNLIAEEFYPSAKTILLASGKNFPDGLSGGPVAAKEDAPVVLVSNEAWDHAHNYVIKRKIVNSITMGGTGVISSSTVSGVMEQYEGSSSGGSSSGSSGGTVTHTHTYGSPAWTWTGYTKAVATFKCTKGDDTKTVNGNITNKITKEATVTDTGTRTYTATVTFNGKSYTNTKTETIPKKTCSHLFSFDEYTDGPHCDKQGKARYICQKCGASEIRVTPAEHQYVMVNHTFCKCGFDKTNAISQLIPNVSEIEDVWATGVPLFSKHLRADGKLCLSEHQNGTFTVGVYVCKSCGKCAYFGEGGGIDTYYNKIYHENKVYGHEDILSIIKTVNEINNYSYFMGVKDEIVCVYNEQNPKQKADISECKILKDNTYCNLKSKYIRTFQNELFN